MKTTLFAVLLTAALVAPAAADRADDDLAAVRKAVASGPEQAAAGGQKARTAEPRWFRVRIVEKTGKRGRVSLNLPLGLVRAFADDWPLQGCRRTQGHTPTVGEVLRALDSGQSLFEVDDEEATVRVWVD
jgi:hypothetical protein